MPLQQVKQRLKKRHDGIVRKSFEKEKKTALNTTKQLTPTDTHRIGKLPTFQISDKIPRILHDAKHRPLNKKTSCFHWMSEKAKT